MGQRTPQADARPQQACKTTRSGSRRALLWLAHEGVYESVTLSLSPIEARMNISWIYQYIYRGAVRSFAVVHDAGAVTVTEPDGDVHRLTYVDGVLTGPGSLAQTHRTAIAAHIAANLAVSEAGL